MFESLCGPVYWAFLIWVACQPQQYGITAGILLFMVTAIIAYLYEQAARWSHVLIYIYCFNSELIKKLCTLTAMMIQCSCKQLPDSCSSAAKSMLWYRCCTLLTHSLTIAVELSTLWSLRILFKMLTVINMPLSMRLSVNQPR